MRKPLMAGNWKMHGTRESVTLLLKGILQQIEGLSSIDLLVLPPFVFLEQTERLLTGSSISWGGQNMSEQAQGAYTGEISGAMLLEFNCRFVLIGHSERRSLYGEDDKLIAAKVKTALKLGLKPILCVGETLAQREAGVAFEVIKNQLETIINVNSIEDWQQLTLAYEPVWAIGTGKTAAPETAQEMHQFIRKLVAAKSEKVADHLRILYGGSIKQNSAAALFNMPDIDGGLIGGASLDANEFIGIAKSCNKL